MKPEHYVNDLRETVTRVQELFDKCRGACPPADADPEAIAHWEGSFGTIRALLVEELQPLLESWEEGEAKWRTTEVMIEGGDPETVIRRAENAPTD